MVTHVDEVVTVLAVDEHLLSFAFHVEGIVAVSSEVLEFGPVLTGPDGVVAVTTVPPTLIGLGVVSSVDQVVIAPEVLVEGIFSVLVVTEEVFFSRHVGLGVVVLLVPV